MKISDDGAALLLIKCAVTRAMMLKHDHSKHDPIRWIDLLHEAAHLESDRIRAIPDATHEQKAISDLNRCSYFVAAMNFSEAFNIMKKTENFVLCYLFSDADAQLLAACREFISQTTDRFPDVVNVLERVRLSIISGKNFREEDASYIHEFLKVCPGDRHAAGLLGAFEQLHGKKSTEQRDSRRTRRRLRRLLRGKT